MRGKSFMDRSARKWRQQAQGTRRRKAIILLYRIGTAIYRETPPRPNRRHQHLLRLRRRPCRGQRQSVPAEHRGAAGAAPSGWTDATFETLTEDDFRKLADLQPEILLLGTGQTLRWPSPSLLQPLMAARIGLEVMDTQAACRTCNILAAEGRKGGGSDSRLTCPKRERRPRPPFSLVKPLLSRARP